MDNLKLGFLNKNEKMVYNVITGKLTCSIPNHFNKHFIKKVLNNSKNLA